MGGGFTVSWGQDGNSYTVNTLQAESNAEKFCTSMGSHPHPGGLAGSSRRLCATGVACRMLRANMLARIVQAAAA